MPSIAAAIISGTINPASTAARGGFMYMKRKYDYVKKIDKNFKKLEEAENFLLAKKRDMKRKEERNRVLMELTTESQTWLEKVGEMEAKVKELKDKYENLHKCFMGMWPFSKLLKLSRDMDKKTKEVDNLKDQIDLDNAMVEKKPEAVETWGPEYENDIPLSLSQHVEKLLKLLSDEDVKTIGIWGMPGIGKSTIMKSLNDHVGQRVMFDIVIWVTVGEEEDIVRRIQLDILARLKLTTQGSKSKSSKQEDAGIISRALENSNYLLLLDQVPMDIKLDDVGIRGKHKLGKVVIASRNKLDCNRMDIQRVIKISRLSEDDAWKLFRKIVGNVADHPRINSTAKRIVRELGGHPQAIRTVAANLKDGPESAWSGALSALQSPDVSQLQHFKELVRAFKFSYNRLLDDDRKKCLLYGALFPNDYKIEKDYLMECWRSEEFISDIQPDGGQKLRVSRDRGHLILHELTEASLFEWSSRGSFLTMPVVFRMIALEFPYPQEEGGCSLLVKPKQQLNSPPEMEKWRDARRVSLISNELSSLKESPECPKITTLLLQRNKQLMSIHNLFFHHMKKLRVLDLYHTRIQSLPASVANLTDLKALYLNECQELVCLSEHVTKLSSTLEILDIRDTGMESLPIEVAELVSLRCLRASFNYDLKTKVNGNLKLDDQKAWRIIPEHVIEKLPQLEELTIIVDTREQIWKESVESVVEEIAKLTYLTTLRFYFPGMESLSTFINKSFSWNNKHSPWRENSFRSFFIRIGSNTKHHNYDLDSSRGPAERHVRFSADHGIFFEELQKVLKQASSFELIGNQEIQSLSDIQMDCMESLEVCIVEGCHKLSSIINSDVPIKKDAFPFLEKLHLFNLQNLSYIWKDSVGRRSFSNLTILTLQECHRLRSAFTASVVKTLERLQRLSIENCSGIQEIIETQEPSNREDEVQNLSGALLNLEILELINLPSLTSICTNDFADWRSLHDLEIKSCPALKNLPKRMYIAKHLTRIECTEDWLRCLEFPDEETKFMFSNKCCFVNEESVSVYYTPVGYRDYQPPDLHNLQNSLEEIKRRSRDGVSPSANLEN